ncbi:hypothetical protein CVT25_002188 [Psilocybe cyanescens]|uniref:Uncharacterized protein n=1 Tax=Psilocybe cyanescens TaxID=93625 RepID=A0A409XF75_PSICY|nr:hypothetical protein CVT25_002188 [Psilocybe cyanescens]
MTDNCAPALLWTSNCMCTESMFRHYGLCLSCAVGSFTYPLPASEAQVYIDNAVDNCKSNGYTTLDPPVIDSRREALSQFLRFTVGD